MVIRLTKLQLVKCCSLLLQKLIMMYLNIEYSNAEVLVRVFDSETVIDHLVTVIEYFAHFKGYISV